MNNAQRLLVVAVLVAITLFSSDERDPAFAAPRGIEELCFEQAQRATLPHRRGAWEAFMTNCRG